MASLSEKYGSPLYVYNAEKITSQYNRIINAFKGVKNLKLNYAVKANTNVSILKLFKKSIRFTVKSACLNETTLCVDGHKYFYFKLATDSLKKTHLTFNIDTHVWNLDHLNVRNTALRRSGMKDILKPQSFSPSNTETNLYVGKVNQLPTDLRSELIDALPLNFLDSQRFL